jgi:hypothetical protein
VAVWRPPERPGWMAPEECAAVQEAVRVREVLVRVHDPGCRVRHLVGATTLLDEAYPKAEIAELYHKIWQIELDTRPPRAALQMGHLRCLTPFMVEKEIWAHCLGYNLVRKVAAQAALRAQARPRQVSSEAAPQVVRGGWQKLTGTTGAGYRRLAKSLPRALRKQRVGHRPGRCEPRAVKRPPKPHQRLREARAAARAKLVGKGPAAKQTQTTGVGIPSSAAGGQNRWGSGSAAGQRGERRQTTPRAGGEGAPGGRGPGRRQGRLRGRRCI